jgi:hypothetical protein
MFCIQWGTTVLVCLQAITIQTGRPEDTTSVNDGGFDKRGNKIAGYKAD